MNPFAINVQEYMEAQPASVRASDRIHTADELMREGGHSGLAVVDNNNRAVGVITRSDLLKLEAVPAVTGSTEHKLMRPDHTVSQVMTRAVIDMPCNGMLSDAARSMAEHKVRRVLVTEDGQLRGIVSAWDLVRRTADARVAAPVESLMNPCTAVAASSGTVADALRRMPAHGEHGVVAVDDGWPVGVFSPTEALVAALHPEKPALDSWLSPALLTIPKNLPCHRAAAQALATGARYMVVIDDKTIVGLITPPDFAALGQ